MSSLFEQNVVKQKTIRDIRRMIEVFKLIYPNENFFYMFNLESNQTYVALINILVTYFRITLASPVGQCVARDHHSSVFKAFQLFQDITKDYKTPCKKFIYIMSINGFLDGFLDDIYRRIPPLNDYEINILYRACLKVIKLKLDFENQYLCKLIILANDPNCGDRDLDFILQNFQSLISYHYKNKFSKEEIVKFLLSLQITKIQTAYHCLNCLEKPHTFRSSNSRRRPPAVSTVIPESGSEIPEPNRVGHREPQTFSEKRTVIPEHVSGLTFEETIIPECDSPERQKPKKPFYGIPPDPIDFKSFEDEYSPDKTLTRKKL